jgi:hypothetical protein
MIPRKFLSAFVFILGSITAMILMSSCGAGQPFGPTITPDVRASAAAYLTATATLWTPTPTPLPSIAIKTTKGELKIINTYTTEYWPDSCNPKAGKFDANQCFVKAKPNYTILIIQYSGTEPEKSDRDAAYVTEDDRPEQQKIGLTGFSDKVNFFGVSVAKVSKKFLLHWPKNEPAELIVGKSPFAGSSGKASTGKSQGTATATPVLSNAEMTIEAAMGALKGEITQTAGAVLTTTATMWTATPAKTATPLSTPTKPATATFTPIPPSATYTPSPTATKTATSTPTPSETATPTSTFTSTATKTPTGLPGPKAGTWKGELDGGIAGFDIATDGKFSVFVIRIPDASAMSDDKFCNIGIDDVDKVTIEADGSFVASKNVDVETMYEGLNSAQKEFVKKTAPTPVVTKTSSAEMVDLYKVTGKFTSATTAEGTFSTYQCKGLSAGQGYIKFAPLKGTWKAEWQK